MSYLVDNYLEDLQEIIPLVAAGIAFSAINALVGATTLYKKQFTKAALRCKDLPDREKAICMIRSKILSKNIQLQAIKSNLANCVKTKNPEKCKTKLATKMKKIEDDIKFLTGRFKELRGQKYT